jgi:hypothetical protein
MEPAKQKCTGKTQETQQLNAKIVKTKGDLTALFDRIPVTETVKAKQLIKLYHGNDAEKEQELKKNPQYQQQVLTIINQYFVRKNKAKNAQKNRIRTPTPKP